MPVDDDLNPQLVIPPGEQNTSSIKELESSVIAGINQRYRNPWAKARRPIVQQALMNHAFLNGFQYIRHDGRNLVPLPRRYKNQVRLVNNLLRPTARTILSLVTKNKPILDATAMTDEYVDEATTEVAQKLLKYLWRVTASDRLAQELWLWMFKGGTAFKRVMWNPDGGAPDEIPQEDDNGIPLMMDLEDGVTRNQEEVTEIVTGIFEDDPTFDVGSRFEPILVPSFPGEVSVRVYSCMEVLADPAAKSLEDADKCIIETVRTLDFIRQAFPVRGKEVLPETETNILFDFQTGSRFTPGMGIPGVTGFPAHEKESLPDRATVRELFIRPTEVNPLTGQPAPLGVHFVWAGNVALTPPDNPLPYAETPMTPETDLDFDIVKYDWFLESGFWSSPYFTDLLPLQRSLNRRRSQINESINAFVHPKLQTAMGSKIKRSAFSDVAGERIEYTGAPASYLEPPSIRPYVFQSMEMDIKQFNDVAMLHEAVRQGAPPPQVRTAAGLRFLQEQDNNALGATLELYEYSEARYGQKLLDRVQQFYPDERVIDYVGENHRVESELFSRNKLFSHNWRVWVHQGSALPDSRAAKVAEANEMLQYAPWMFVDPRTREPDRKLYARLIGRHDIDSYMKELDESRAAAETEHIQMGEGIPVPVLSFEDHATHWRTHMAFMQTAEFKRNPPEIMEVFLIHVSEHEQLMPQQAQQMQQAAGMVQDTASAAEEAVSRQSAAEAAAAAARNAVAEQNATGQPPVGGGDQGVQPQPGVQDPGALIQQLMGGGQ